MNHRAFIGLAAAAVVAAPGVTRVQQTGKRLQLVREVVPKAARRPSTACPQCTK